MKPGERQHGTDDENEDAQDPEDVHGGDETDDEQDYSEDDHRNSLVP
jgi:hypothetical protein